jgi:hypothetical protein
MRRLLLSLIASVALALPASAATYRYDVSYSFPILRDQGLGAFAQNRPGAGSVSGYFVIADDFFTTGVVQAWELTTVNTSTGFSNQNSYRYSSRQALDGQSYAPPNGSFDPAFSVTFGNGNAAVDCNAGLVAPSGQHANRTYSINGSALILRINRAFTPGDASFSMLGQEHFGRAPLCTSNGFADGGWEHTAPGSSFVVSGSIAPVPLPAGLPLLAAGLGGFGLMRRLRRR